MKTTRWLNLLIVLALTLMNVAPALASAAPVSNVSVINPIAPQNAPQADRPQLTPEVSVQVAPGNTAGLPVAAVVKAPVKPITSDQIEVRDTNRLLPKGQSAGKPTGDKALQTSVGQINMPSPDLNFDGVDNADGVHPPDTNGEVGKDHYIQMVNLSMAIYDKSGTLLYGPFHPNELWPTGDVCRTTNDGDPVVLFDQLADRWIVSQFALPNYPYGPFYECIAVSKSGTPTNNPADWYPYTFRVHNTKMDDYPKLSVWPDGYYMTVNQFTAGAGDWAGAGVFSFDRAKMLNGLSASFVYFDIAPVELGYGGMLPADVDGSTLPPVGAPAYFFEVDDDVLAPALGPDSMRIWKFHVDWTTPLSSTFGLSGQPNNVLPVANFDLLPCVIAEARGCIPQQGTVQKLDSLGDRLMFRAAYRNFGDHESVMINHTVRADGADRAGVRWYEVRNPSTTPTIYQQGTYAPADGKYRWMGSIAMDHAGNVALGYSTSSSSMYPSINYAGRLSTDALNTLPEAEATIIDGTGTQTSPYARWGDYSDMTVDPVDDCTFWYTQEYLQTTGYAPWRTRIASFSFPGCSLGAQGLLSGTVTNANTSAPLAGAAIQATAGVTNSRSTATNASGVYETNLAVGVYSVTAAKYGFISRTVNGVPITDTLTTIRNFALTPAPTYIVSGTVKDAVTGWPLYAQIAIGGAYPGNPIWTNPATGFYSITLVAGLNYAFNVTSFSLGYQAASNNLNHLSANTTLNFVLNPDLQSCSAPGYAFNVNGAYANFDQVAPPALPAGWSSEVVDMAPGHPKWATNAGTLTGVPAHSEPNLVYFNSASVFFGGSSRLTYNNPIDFSTVPTTTLTFWMYHDNAYAASADAATVQVSTDGGSTWSDAGESILRYSETVGWQQHSVSLSAYAGQKIYLGFFGTSEEGGDLYLDDILLGTAPCEPGQGGLVVGTVSDANTGLSLNDATVSDQSGNSTLTVATPADTTNPDGFFTLFAPTGMQAITATQYYYTAQTANVNVSLGGSVRQNFALPAGHITFTPATINLTQNSGANTTLPLTLTNLGGAAAAVKIVELDKGVVPFGPFEKPRYVVKPFRQQFKDALSLNLPAGPIAPPAPRAAGDVLTSWATTSVNSPWGVAYDARDNSVWVGSGWDAAKNITEFRTDGTATGRSQPFNWNPPYGPADAAYNWNTDKLWIMNVGTTDNCIYEIDPGSGPTGATICPTGLTGFAVSQRGLAYDPSTDTYFAGGWGDQMVYRFRPDGTLINSRNVGIAIAGLAYNPATGHLFAVDSASTSKFYMLDVNHNYNLVGSFAAPFNFGGAGLEIDCVGNLWAVDQTGKQVYQLESGESTSVCSNDVSWLSTAPVTTTIATMSNQPVAVTVDAAGLQPGLYDAQLKFNNDTPYFVSNLPIKMTVNPPATWGKLSGSVSTPGYCEVEPAALAGITVTIQSATGTWSTVTDADGNYRNWFDQSYSPVTVTVNTTGYQVQQYTGVNITAGNVTVRDFVLRWLQPCVTTRPGPITVTLGLGEATSRSFFAANNGAASTPYNYTEQILAGQNPGINLPASNGKFAHSPTSASSEVAPRVNVTATTTENNPLATVAPVPAYAFDLYNNALVNWANLNTPETWTTVGSTGSGGYFAADFLGADFSQLYALDRYSNEFVTFNTSTLTRTLIGTATPYIGEDWSGLTGSTTGVLYASSTACNSASSLYTINPQTGAATRIGAITGAGCIIDIAIDRTGNLYGLDIITNRLYQIDMTTGAGTPIGPVDAIGFEADYAQGMDFDQVTNILYLAAFSLSTGGELRVADTTTGGSVRVGGFPAGTEVDGLAIATGLGITTDIPWLTETPVSGTLPADTSITTTLDFNANAVAAPGTYRAGLTLNTNDPFDPSRQSIMTFIVNAPFSWGVLSGDITTLGYCDANPASLAGAQLTLQGVSGAPRTVTTDVDGHYTLWLDSLKNPYTMTVTAAGQVPNSASGLTVNSFGAVTTKDLALRSIQPCVHSAPDSLSVTLPWGGSITQTLTLSNTGAGATPYTLTEKSGGFIPTAPAALPKILVVNDNGPYANLTNVEAFTTALTALGYPYDVVDSNTDDGILGTLRDYAAVIYAGTPDTGAEQDQLIGYLDEGGKLLIADNELGFGYGTTPFYTTYLQAQFASIGGSKGSLAGMDIMSGITTNASADENPNSFTLNGPDAVGIFKNVAPFTDWAGSRIQRADYKAVYLAWDYRYTGSEAITDTAKTDVLGPALDWLLAVDDVLPWLTENPIIGTLPANTGLQNINVAFNANAVTQPGTYYGALQVKSNDAQRGTFRVPITMTIVPTATQGKLNGVVTDLGYCDANPAPFAYAPLQIQGRNGYSATVKADVAGYYQQWLYQSNSPYTVTVAAEGYVTKIISGNAVTSAVTTTLPIELRRAQPCVGVIPNGLAAQLVLGDQTTLPFTLTNSGAASLSFNLHELDYGTTPPSTKPEILIAEDMGNPVAASAFAATLQKLGYTYEITRVSWYVGFPVNLSDYRAVIYIGDVYRGATFTQLSNYLDAGGKLLFSSNSFGVRAVYANDLRFSEEYLEMTYAGEFPYAANVPITGTDIMAGVNTSLSSDPYPEYFTINGPHGTGIFSNENDGMWTGERVDNGYRLIYLAWNFEYTGSTAPLDPAKLAIVQRSLNWLLGDVPWLSENITSGTVAADTGAQSIGVTLNSNVPQITQPGDYYAMLKVASNDPVNPGVNVPITLTVQPPATWAKFEGTINTLAACDVNPTPAPNATVTVQTNAGSSYTLTSNTSGHYQIWLPAANSPLTLTVSNTGYVTQIKSGISGANGAVIVNNFDLRLEAPCLQVTPDTLLSRQKTNQQTTQALLISNTGVAPLNWSIEEQAAAGLRPIVIDTLPAPVMTGDRGQLSHNTHSAPPATAPQSFSPLPAFNMTSNVSLTQSTSQDLIFGTSMACSEWFSGNTLANSYYRVYDLPANGITDNLKVSGIEIGIEEATTSVGQQLLNVKLYTLNGDFVLSNLTLIASANYTITDQILTHVVLPITTIVPAGSKLVVEVYSPNTSGDNNIFYLGANDLPETGQSYIRSAPCGIDEPTSTDDQGMPSHYVLNVIGTTWPTCAADLPWASVHPLSGNTAANASSPIDVVFNSTGLADGVYTDNLCLFSNDQLEPVAGVPLQMIVGLIHKIYLPLIAKSK